MILLKSFLCRVQNSKHYTQIDYKDSLNTGHFSSYQLNAHFLYSIIIYMLHYNPQHISSNNLRIFRRTNFIITASVIVTLCKWPYSTPVESGLSIRSQSAYSKAVYGE